jgi:glycosyltransferase involved in cell wall biosynthesis
MRILVHDFGGYPFIFQLSRSLASRNHEVLHLVAGGFRSAKGAAESLPGDPASLRIEQVMLEEPMRQAGIARLLQERRYARLAARRAAAFEADVILSANSPLSVQRSLLDAAHSNGAAFVFWLQDLHSVAIGRILARRLGPIGSAIGGVFGRIERRLLRTSDIVVPITDDFVAPLRAWKVADQRIRVLQNWAPTSRAADDVVPGEWARRHGIPAGPLLLYSGTLAMKHNPQLLAAIAHGIPDAQLVVVADGAGAISLEESATGIPNLHVLPLQPHADVPAMLAAADVLLAILEPDASTFSVPSKVLTYLAAGRPIVAAMPASNPAARTIEHIGAGVVVDPSQPTLLVAAARTMLYDDNARMAAGAAGHAFARKAFDIETITDDFEELLRQAVDRKSRSGDREQPDTDSASSGRRGSSG